MKWTRIFASAAAGAAAACAAAIAAVAPELPAPAMGAAFTRVELPQAQRIAARINESELRFGFDIRGFLESTRQNAGKEGARFRRRGETGRRRRGLGPRASSSDATRLRLWRPSAS